MRKRYSVDKSLSHPWLQVMQGAGLELAFLLAGQVVKGVAHYGGSGTWLGLPLAGYGVELDLYWLRRL